MGLLGTLAILLGLLLIILICVAMFFELGELRRTVREFIDREGGGRHAGP